MTTEQKAIAYDKAIEIAKEKKSKCDKAFSHIEVKNLIEDIFPELKDSEDEKRRKELKHYLEVKRCQTHDDEEYVMCNRALAWLEKQKNLSDFGKYVAEERNKVGFYFEGDEVSWEQIPLNIRKHDYPYYFDGDLDCFPFVVEKHKPKTEYVYTKFRKGDVIRVTTANGSPKDVRVQYIEDGSYVCRSDDGTQYMFFQIKNQDEYELVE